MREPDRCGSMLEVRAGVDALDVQIVTLLAVRMRFMEAAARIKTGRDQVRDEPRKAAVIAQARAVADRVGFPAQLAASLYELLVEASIAHELRCFDEAPRVPAGRMTPDPGLQGAATPLPAWPPCLAGDIGHSAHAQVCAR